MKALWIFLILVIFCVYVLLGLHFTDGIESFTQIILTWVIYTILWITFILVFVLGYFWSVIRNKKGPTGLRGPSGENGKIGIEGTCGIDSIEAFLIKALNGYIDGLYYSKSNKHILNDETQKFNNQKYLNNKISTMAGSRQYKIIVANLSKDNKPVISIINYIKSIWKQWFDLLYDATEEPGVWFTDEFADEEYTWSQDNNPFDEIKKYDIYYWGLTRNFRPLKAEICRSNSTYESSKLPMPNIAREPRLKIIQTNDYYKIGDTESSDGNAPNAFLRAKKITFGSDTFYPVGDIMTHMDKNPQKNTNSKTITGELQSVYEANDSIGFNQYYNNYYNGPDMKTILVSGDVVDPIRFDMVGDLRCGDSMRIFNPVCPDGYESLGDVTDSWMIGNGTFRDIKCVPSECVEDVANSNSGENYEPGIFNKYHIYWEDWPPGYEYGWDFNVNVLNYWRKGDNEAKPEYGYNLTRTGGSKPFRKIKDSCLKPPEKIPPITKDVETPNGDLGIGWNGHPYKLDPKYSIFTFLNLVPEGMIVNKGSGRRFYIIHYGGEEANIYIILDYSKDSGKYDNALQVSTSNSTTDESRIKSVNILRTEIKQQWQIILQQDKKILTLKNLSNNKYLYIGLEPKQGFSQFSSIDLDNNKYKNNVVFSRLTIDEINNATHFTFIPSFGTHMNIIDK